MQSTYTGGDDEHEHIDEDDQHEHDDNQYQEPTDEHEDDAARAKQRAKEKYADADDAAAKAPMLTVAMAATM